MSDWFRSRLYEAAWRLVFTGDDALYEMRDGLAWKPLVESLASGRWFDAELLRAACATEEPEAVVRRFSREFVPEQLARLAGLPRGSSVEEAVEVLRRLEGGSDEE